MKVVTKRGGQCLVESTLALMLLMLLVFGNMRLMQTMLDRLAARYTSFFVARQAGLGTTQLQPLGNRLYRGFFGPDPPTAPPIERPTLSFIQHRHHIDAQLNTTTGKAPHWPQ